MFHTWLIGSLFILLVILVVTILTQLWYYEGPIRLIMIQYWIIIRYAFWKPYYLMIQDAYGRNDAIELLYKCYHEQTNEHMAASHYYEEDCNTDSDSEIREEDRQYLADLSEALRHVENALDYMIHEEKYISTHWDFYHGRPKDQYLEYWDGGAVDDLLDPDTTK